jgi:hypothetical protein
MRPTGKWKRYQNKARLANFMHVNWKIERMHIFLAKIHSSFHFTLIPSIAILNLLYIYALMSKNKKKGENDESESDGCQ